MKAMLIIMGLFYLNPKFIYQECNIVYCVVVKCVEFVMLVNELS